MATIRRKPILAVVLIAIPPVVALAAAAALGWIRFEWSLTGVVYVIGAYAGWIAILAGLAEFLGFLREEQSSEPRLAPPQLGRVDVGDYAQDVAVGEHITQTHVQVGTYVAGDYIEGARQASHTLFDQRDQQVGTQYNIGGDYVSPSTSPTERNDAPQLRFSTDVDLSVPTPAEEQAGAKRSWFIRLRIENLGQSRATNCQGRLLEVRDEAGNRRKQLESLDLYWTRQDRPDNYRPLDIQGNGDFRYLDVAQVIEAENVLRPRVVVAAGHRLVQSPVDAGRPGDLPPGTYYVRTAIYADNDSIKPTWFRLSWTNDFSVDPPCRMELAEPPPERQ
jgi:hypothetical protein